MSAAFQSKKFKMIKKIIIIALIIAGILATILLLPKIGISTSSSQSATALNFFSTNQNAVIEETDSVKQGANSAFWVNSGAFFYIKNGIGSTNQAKIPTYSKWRVLYAKKNATDTDNGYYPQNIFRLLTKNSASNVQQEMYINVVRDNLSGSPNRNSSNGIFLIQRYQDSDNLYYIGIRVDGTAIIKKKFKGVYTTLAQKQIFKGDIYDRNSSPNLIPKNSWIGVRSRIENISSKDEVTLSLEIDTEGTGKWKKVISVKENADKGNVIITTSGYGGIRSDFMDIEFKNYSFVTIPADL